MIPRLQPLGVATFGAMGVNVTVAGLGVTPRQIAIGTEMARGEAERWETTFSRFRPDSELSQLNLAEGDRTHVSPLFVNLLERAMEGVRESEGRFNPAILTSLEQAGYDRSFELLENAAEGDIQTATGITDASWIDEVEIDTIQSTVRIPAGVRLDFGGLAKGAFVDAVVERLRHWPGGYVDAGGDLRVWGEPPNGHGWSAGIEDPDDPSRNISFVNLHEPAASAVATSGTYRRRWKRGTIDMHHLIDPASGLPLSDHFRSVTVVGSSVVDAEVETKSLLVAGSRGLPMKLQRGHMAWICTSSGMIEVIVNEHPEATVSSNHDSRAAA